MAESATQERFKRGAADAGRYFKYMADFVGFSEEDRQAIKDSRFIVEKHIPAIVGRFYVQLLRYPATRKFFLKKDGTVDQAYLAMRMQHQVSFWRRTASAGLSEDYARFTDYVGRAHTSRGADPKIYIPERYVIGMVGFVQHNLMEALHAELHEIDPELEARAAKGWSKLLTVLLEMLTRAYGEEHLTETFSAPNEVDHQALMDLSIETYERSLGIADSIETITYIVGKVEDIPEGSRKIVQVEDLSIGVFHHKGQWYALHNSCLHRGGPVCTGVLDGDTITCPWHGYQYNLPDGRLLLDEDATLPMYPVEIVGGNVQIKVPILVRDAVEISMSFGEVPPPAPEPPKQLASNQFLAEELKPGQARLVHVDGERVAAVNVDGEYYAIHDECSHVGGPLSEGEVKGHQLICPWHASCFDVRDGSVQCGPAKEPVKAYRVSISAGIATVQAG
jgi:nitrite reductase/ring-hydroxylating ferredoxin subunit/hemoglobin-like flavoprotein